MNFASLSFFVICTAQLLLALVVLLKNRRSYTNISFFIFTLSIIVWIISNYYIDRIGDSGVALVVMKIIFISSGLAPFALLIFSMSLAGLEKKMTAGKMFLLTTIPALSILFCFNDFVIKGLAKSGDVWGVVFGPLSFLYSFYLIGYFGLALAVLYWGFKRSSGVNRIRFQYVFTGLSLGIAFATLTNFILPFFSDEFNYVMYGPYATIFITGFIAYAIIRHKLFDIRPVVARSLAYLLSIATIALLYGFLTFRITTIFTSNLNKNTQYAIFTALAVVLAFTFHPLRRFFERLTDKIFFRDKYDPQIVINSIGRVLASEINLDRLSKKVISEINSQLRISSADIVVVNEKSIFYQAQVQMAQNREYSLKDLGKLSRAVLVADELTGGERKEVMTKYGIDVSLALRTSEEFIGYLLLGAKLSGDIYNEIDLKVLRIIANELAIAIQNAKSYAEIRRFNETLQQKIVLATKKLRDANANLKELDKAKDEFISMASHQLRTPLTTTKGYISMVLDGDFGKINKGQLEPLTQALDSANRMAGLVSDLLNVSRMDAGKFFIDAHEVDLVQLVGAEVNGLKSLADSKGIKLSYQPPAQALPLLNLDEDKTSQVIMNLVDNAIHYSAPAKGGGQVSVSLQKDGSEVVFKVVDNGIGVPEKMKERLFTKFYRAANAQAARPDGTGLGLYLVKRVVEDQGGQLIFESTEGVGSTFGFRLPIKTKIKASATRARVPLSAS